MFSFSLFSLKSLNLRNRIVMAPMTREMSPGGVPDMTMSPRITAAAPKAKSA